MQIKIEKSQKTIEKELKQARINELKSKTNITNQELRYLLIQVLEMLESR